MLHHGYPAEIRRLKKSRPKKSSVLVLADRRDSSISLYGKVKTSSPTFSISFVYLPYIIMDCRAYFDGSVACMAQDCSRCWIMAAHFIPAGGRGSHNSGEANTQAVLKRGKLNAPLETAWCSRLYIQLIQEAIQRGGNNKWPFVEHRSTVPSCPKKPKDSRVWNKYQLVPACFLFFKKISSVDFLGKPCAALES